MVDKNSQWYPYQKVQTNNFNFEQFAMFPRLICDYLIDAPQGDYQPKDDNRYSRCRLWKYLYHDGEKPLNKKLPTIKEKLSILFNPNKPTTPPTDKGYRLIPQTYIMQAQDKAQTRIYVYLGRSIAQQDDNTYVVSVVFDILTHYTYELNTKADEYSRSGAIVAALIEALNGVNITGIGTFSMSKRVHPDCGTKPIRDNNENVGVELIMGLEMATTTNQEFDDNSNMNFFSPDGKIKMW